ncbi:MAG: hypothetical protein IPN54_09335 [Bacteroidetes bacterium]|nr:hypothetical protein [Bacteroidota bacterium]
MLLFFNSIKKAEATHTAGADLTYRSLGGLVYEITATFYRDCGGTAEPGNMTIYYKSASCGFNRTALANKIPGDNGTEITMPCATAPSTCAGGNSPGIQKWVYRTVVTLPAALQRLGIQLQSMLQKLYCYYNSITMLCRL